LRGCRARRGQPGITSRHPPPTPRRRPRPGPYDRGPLHLGRKERPMPDRLKTSLGIWALGGMVTRFVPVGYQPEHGSESAAVKVTLDACEFAGEIGAHFIIWPGVEGYNYPFQTPYADSWARFIDGVGQAATALASHGQMLFLEHKNSEPAMKIFMRNIGMT